MKKQCVGIVSVLLCLVGALAGLQGASAAVPPELQSRLSVTQAPLAQATAPVVGNLSVTGQFDQVTYPQGGFARLTVAVGQPAGQTAHIGLVQAYPDGRVVQLFPHPWQPNNVVAGNNSFQVLGGVAGTNQIEPRGLYVNDPPGTYLVKLIASTDAAALNGLLSITRADELTRALGDADLKGSGTVWSMDAIAYTVAGGVATPTQPVGTAPVVPVTQPVAQPAAVPANLANMKSDFYMSIHTKDNRQSFKVGEPLVFQVSAAKSCELGLASLSPTNQLSVEFPNAMVEPIDLKKNKVAWIPTSESPYSLKPSQPGTYTYLAVCSRKKGFWNSIMGWLGRSAEERSTLVPESTVTVADLLKDDPDSEEGRAYVTVQVVQ